MYKRLPNALFSLGYSVWTSGLNLQAGIVVNKPEGVSWAMDPKGKELLGMEDSRKN